MSNILLDVAEVGKGHEEHKYDSSDKQSLEDMIEFVLAKLKKGFQLYGSKDAEDYVKILSKNKSATNDEVKKLFQNMIGSS